MHSKLPRLILTLSVLCPAWSWALGLGEIHLNSALNEPLDAEIALVAATAEELGSLHAALASRETFSRYGIDRPAFLSSITFQVGKGRDGHEALLVRSREAVPEPFVTFLVEVSWPRGRLVREYTVLLDPPTYAPATSRQAAVAAPVAGSTGTSQAGTPRQSEVTAPAGSSTATLQSASGAPGTYEVRSGDTLMKIARNVSAGSQAGIDQTMMALYHANPQAFEGNINILRRGAVLRLPGADDIAAQNQREAISEVRRQMSAWKGSRPADEGHLRLVPPASGSAATAEGSASGSEAAALRGRVKDLEQQLTESRRLLDVRNAELAQLQKKLGVPPTQPASPVPAQTKPAESGTPSQQAAPVPSAAPETVPPEAAEPATASSAAQPAKPKPAHAAPSPEQPAGSWLDWITGNWWMLALALLALLGGLGFAGWKRRQASDREFSSLIDTGVAEPHDRTSRLLKGRKPDESILVEESGEHPQPVVVPVSADVLPARTDEPRAPEDTLSSEAAIDLDQGDPLAEADFHMAYGLYDQAADLVRIALEREPDRRDLKLKLLEIYFVWGNKDLFLQTARDLHASRDKAPEGEWDKILIMGKQICPDEPLFAGSAGAGMGAGALVDLNLEGGENRVDIDLFGEPHGEQGASESGHPATAATATGEAPAFAPSADLDFVLDAPERGSEDAPTREMPVREEPTVESEVMPLDSHSPTAEWNAEAVRARLEERAPATEATAELALDDLGLDLDALEQTGSPSLDQTGSRSLDSTDHPGSVSLDATDHPSDAPTMVAGLDEHSRKLMADAEKAIEDRDLTELERELEASFIADLEHSTAGAQTAVIPPEAAPTVNMPREAPLDFDVAATSRQKALDVSHMPALDAESTSRLKALSPDASIDLDLDRLANAFSGSGDTKSQPRAADEVFSSEVFEEGSAGSGVDLDVGAPAGGSVEQDTTRVQGSKPADTDRIKTFEGDLPELEPVTMSEVGTKLDLARAYMDMGDPEGARSILEEVEQEGSASQKQEARRLIESLPG